MGLKKRRLRMTVAYDGTDYSGWQYQPTGQTIQGRIEEALSGILQARVKITGAGRTDAGVHALGQVAHFDTLSELPVKVIQRALNAILPEDIRVISMAEVNESFHARYSAIWKLYRYLIADGSLPEALFLRRTSWVRATDLDENTLTECASLIEGEHDFFSFSKKEGSRQNRRCRVYSAGWTRSEGSFCFEIKADRYLRAMVRMLVGGMVAVAEGKADVEEFRLALEKPGRWLKAVPAPACGLTLVEVGYPE